MKAFLQAVGAIVIFMLIAGMLGIGDFHLIFSDQKHTCTAVSAK